MGGRGSSAAGTKGGSALHHEPSEYADGKPVYRSDNVEYVSAGEFDKYMAQAPSNLDWRNPVRNQYPVYEGEVSIGRVLRSRTRPATYSVVISTKQPKRYSSLEDAVKAVWVRTRRGVVERP